MPKNIVVLSDGTGQEGGRGVTRNTNIYKLFNMLEDRTPRQIVFYDPGLGTGGNRITGNVGGAGISQNILQAYRFIFDHYQPRDRIFLIGFSRGATTVRSLAGFIHHFGILPKARPDLIAKAYKIYRTRAPLLRWWAENRIKKYPVYSGIGSPWKRYGDRLLLRSAQTCNLNHVDGLASALLLPEWKYYLDAEESRDSVDDEEDTFTKRRDALWSLWQEARERAEELHRTYWAEDREEGDLPKDSKKFIRALRLHVRAQRLIAANHTQWTKIHFLGCFDTVAALGLPFPVANAVINRMPGLQHKFHNLGLSPSVVHAYQALAIDDRRKVFAPVLWEGCSDRQTVRQVWFAGMHTDVGGGYHDHGLADVTLVWMLRKAHEHGLLQFAGHRERVHEDPTDVMHDSRGTWLTKRLYSERERRPPEGDLLVHESVFRRAKARKIKVWKKGNAERVAGETYRPGVLAHPHRQEPWVRYDPWRMFAEQERKWDAWIAELQRLPPHLSPEQARTLSVSPVRFGERGKTVEYWQYRLLDLDPESLPLFGVDGHYGRETANAVTKAVPGSDGMQIGEEEIDALNSRTDSLAAGYRPSRRSVRLAEANAPERDAGRLHPHARGEP